MVYEQVFLDPVLRNGSVQIALFNCSFSLYEQPRFPSVDFLRDFLERIFPGFLGASQEDNKLRVDTDNRLRSTRIDSIKTFHPGDGAMFVAMLLDSWKQWWKAGLVGAPLVCMIPWPGGSLPEGFFLPASIGSSVFRTRSGRIVESSMSDGDSDAPSVE